MSMRRPLEKPAASRPPIKPVAWCGSALDVKRSFPAEARREAGFQLSQLQEGKAADDWKPMSTVGQGTIEIRIHTGTEHRVFVVTRFASGSTYYTRSRRSRRRHRNEISTLRNDATVR